MLKKLWKSWSALSEREIAEPPFVFGLRAWRAKQGDLYYRSVHKKNSVDGFSLCYMDLYLTDENIIRQMFKNAIKELLEMDEYSNRTTKEILDGYVMENMRKHTEVIFSKVVEDILDEDKEKLKNTSNLNQQSDVNNVKSVV